MIKKKKVCFSLKRKAITIINNRSFLEDVSTSVYVSNCIKYGYNEFKDQYHENGNKPLSLGFKKYINTIKQSFLLPIDVIDQLDMYSKMLEIKKSHLVYAAVMMLEEDIEKLEGNQQSKENMAIGEGFENEEISIYNRLTSSL